MPDDLKPGDIAYARLGYLVWYAYAVGPDGVRVKLHEGNPYY